MNKNCSLYSSGSSVIETQSFMGYSGVTKEAIILHSDTLKKIEKLKDLLQKTHGVNEWTLQKYYNLKKCKKYREDWRERLSEITDENDEVLGLTYWFNTFSIAVKESENKILLYLEAFGEELLTDYKRDSEAFLKNNLMAFVTKRKNYVLKKAKKDEVDFLKPRIKSQTLEELGGKDHLVLPKLEDYKYDEEYYALYFKEEYANKIGELQTYFEHKLDY